MNNWTCPVDSDGHVQLDLLDGHPFLERVSCPVLSSSIATVFAGLSKASSPTVNSANVATAGALDPSSAGGNRNVQRINQRNRQAGTRAKWRKTEE